MKYLTLILLLFSCKPHTKPAEFEFEQNYYDHTEWHFSERSERVFSLVSSNQCQDLHYIEIKVGDSTYRPFYCTYNTDTLSVNVSPFFDTLFTKAKYIKAGGKIFKDITNPH